MTLQPIQFGGVYEAKGGLLVKVENMVSCVVWDEANDRWDKLVPIDELGHLEPVRERPEVGKVFQTNEGPIVKVVDNHTCITWDFMREMWGGLEGEPDTWTSHY